MKFHERRLALAMDRVTDEVLLLRERVSRHEIILFDWGDKWERRANEVQCGRGEKKAEKRWMRC